MGALLERGWAAPTAGDESSLRERASWMADARARPAASKEDASWERARWLSPLVEAQHTAVLVVDVLWLHQNCLSGGSLDRCLADQ
jgi:hypothetical protein